MSFEEYFKKLGCDYWHEYPKVFRFFDFRDKVFINIGGDCGSACVWAHLNGAKRCIMYEADPKLFTLAYDVARTLGVDMEIHGIWNGNTYPDGDIFTIDCEGCEESLDVDLVVSKYSQIGVAVHEWTRNKGEILRKLADYGFRLAYVTPDYKEQYYVLVK